MALNSFVCVTSFSDKNKFNLVLLYTIKLDHLKHRWGDTVFYIHAVCVQEVYLSN